MKNRLDRFHDLTWDDINAWTRDKIVSRGRSYRKRGRVSDLATTDEGSLIAMVRGTERYATKVEMTEDGRPYSICSCRYGVNCKHGVAVVLEYLECVKNELPVPEATEKHPFYTPPEDEDFDEGEWDEEDFDIEARDYETRRDDAAAIGNAVSAHTGKETNAFLEGKTKKELIGLIRELAAHHPEVRDDLADRRRIVSGKVKSLLKRLRREIREIGAEQGWQNHWNSEGFTPDYSGVRSRFDVLVKAGHADEVLRLGEELLRIGGQQVEESQDEGETGMELASCMPAIVRALEQSSLSEQEKLAWAVDVLLDDQYDLCEAFGEYLLLEHDQAVWDELADQLMARLDLVKSDSDEFTNRYLRNGLSNWIIHALECSGRTEEIVPLCEAEAILTGSYDRLVEQLIAQQRYDDAERWIHEGISATEIRKWGGTAVCLRDRLIQIRKLQKDYSAVAAIQVEDFVRNPSSLTFESCRTAARKVKAWPKVRGWLLVHLESGELPWTQKDWPLPESGLDAPEEARPGSFPMINTLISIAIEEKKPDRVLYWHDKRTQERYPLYGPNEDRIADAIANHAPERAIDIWKKKAEESIGYVNVGAYRSAADYLRKAAAVMIREKKQKEWDRYLLQLREQHRRKRRLIEILDGMDGTPIVKIKV